MCCFFVNDTAPTDIYTLSLHDALPIFSARRGGSVLSISSAGTGRLLPLTDKQPPAPPVSAAARTTRAAPPAPARPLPPARTRDRKSTRLKSSHANISYAVFCLKKKK